MIKHAIFRCSYWEYFQIPTLHNLFCNRFCRPGRNKCRSHPGTGCTLHTSGRLHATPGRGRLLVCTGHGSDFHILHTWRILASLQRSHNIFDCSTYVVFFYTIFKMNFPVSQWTPLFFFCRSGKFGCYVTHFCRCKEKHWQISYLQKRSQTSIVKKISSAAGALTRNSCSPAVTKTVWYNRTEQFSLLTFGMIPHITQERRAEDNIHHTGRVEGTVVDAEMMWGDDRPFGCLPDNVCLSGLQGGRRGWCRVPHAAALTSWRQRRTCPIALLTQLSQLVRGRKKEKTASIRCLFMRKSLRMQMLVCGFFK